MIELIVVLVIVGAVIYLVRAAPVIDPFVKQVIYVIAVVVLLVYVLRHLGALGL